MSSMQLPKGFTKSEGGKLWLSGDQFFEDAWKLTKKLRSTRHFEHIYCLARGGFPLGAIVGNGFGKSDVHSLQVSSYKGEKRGEVNIASKFSEEMIASGGQSVLFLDDLVDSGGTAQALKQLLPRSHIAVVYAKKNSKHLVDSYEVIIPDIWVIFPWEKPMSEFDSHS